MPRWQIRTKQDKTGQNGQIKTRNLSRFVIAKASHLLEIGLVHRSKPMDLISRIIAAFKTYVRGIALPGEKPLFAVTPMMVVAATALVLIFDLSATQLIWSSQRAWLYPLFLPLFALGQASFWYLYMVQHQAVHGAISKRRWVNRLVAELASIVTLAQPPSLYRPRHLREHHHPQRLATSGDPDYRWLKKLGFIEGLEMAEYWALLWRLLRSPAFYLNNVVSRVRGHLLGSPLAQRLSLIFWWALLITASVALQLWVALVMYLVLLVVALPISALLQTITEHRWGSKASPRSKTHPRLLPIDEYPHLFLIYFYWRSAVFSTDLSQHQLHHHKPVTLDWPMIGYSADARADLPRAVWGIRRHFEVVFTSLSQAKPGN